MKKVDVKKVYSQEEIVAEFLRAGELLEACEVAGCRLEACEGCDACDALFEEISLRELEFFMEPWERGVGPEVYYSMADSLRGLHPEAFETEAWWARRSKKSIYKDLISSRDWNWRARRELEFWEVY